MSTASTKAWKKLHPEKEREYQRRKRAKNIAKDILRVKKSQCKKSGIAFDLVEADITPLPEFCPVLGIRLNYAAIGRTDDCASLDRKIPAKGYTKGNVAVISRRANRIKNDGTAEELYKIWQYVVESCHA